VRLPGTGSLAAQVRVLIVGLVVVLGLGTVLVLAQLTAHARSSDVLTLSLGPAFDANNAAMLDMTEANAGWSQQVSGTAPVIRYRLKEDLVRADLDAVTRAISAPSLDEEKRSRYRALLGEQRAAVDEWFAAAKRAEDVIGSSLSTASIAQADAVRAFRHYRDTNRELFTALRAERDEAREDSRSASTKTFVTVSTTALVLVLLIALWHVTIRRVVTAPLIRLRDVVARQREGDRDAQADEGTGVDEVRGLAADFNGLTRANLVLQEQQAAVLLSHQLVLDVARVVHGAPDTETAMQAVCAMLGEGLAADRVLLYTYDADAQIDERTQWHRYDLPDLAPLPPSLAEAVQDVNAELRRDATFFAVPDFLDPEVQAQPRAEGFYRATGTRSMLMVPVGVGERGLGVLSVLMVDGPRRWRRHEIQAAQPCAGYLAQSVVALQLGTMREEQVEQLTALDRQKTDFMATVSHELRTPLTSIAGYLEMLEDGAYGELDERQLDALATIGRNAVRLQGMIEDLLVLNRIEATGLAPSLEHVGVGRLLGGVVEVLGPAAAMAEVDLQTAPVDPSLTVSVDLRHIERTFINLGSNAVKFTPAGGRVEMTAERDGDRARVTVADTGIGIPEVDQGRLFQRFFRASNATDAAIPGTGLGLAIARTIVEGHGGQLELESVEGAGTTVRVWLPLVDPSPATSEGNAGASAPV
jgi:signal transduction histidine kinase